MTKQKPYLDRAEKLKGLRGNISIDEFAKELGINLTTYYRYERGETPVSDGHLKLAEIVRMKMNGAPTVFEPEPAHNPHSGYKTNSEKALGDEHGGHRGRAFDLLAKIYESQDQQLIGAIFSNLKSFAESAEQKRENVELKRKVDELDVRLNEMEGLLNQKGIIKHPERRSGTDRRHANGESPSGEERRVIKERRNIVGNNGDSV